MLWCRPCVVSPPAPAAASSVGLYCVESGRCAVLSAHLAECGVCGVASSQPSLHFYFLPSHSNGRSARVTCWAAAM